MAEWTDSAKHELDRHLERVRRSARRSGADPDEVVEDVRRHAEEEAKAAGLTVVNREDARAILGKLGPPGPDHSPPNGVSLVRSALQVSRKRFPPTFIFLFGILLPAFTLALEAGTGFCGGVFFDPVPTIWHVLLVACVPVTNLMIWIAVRSKKASWYSKLGYASGVAIGVSLFYAVLFLPISPIAVIAVIVYGLGLLPLSPLLAFVASIMARSHMKKATGAVAPGLWVGFAVALGLLVLIELPTTTTRLFLAMAASDSPAQSASGVRWLRRIGSEDVLLRSCYQRPGMATDIVGFLFAVSGDSVRPARAREVYYRVTGTPFNAVPPPRISARGRFRVQEDFEFDADQGGRAVAGRVKGLSLHGSRIDGSLDAEAALAYLEWTLVFKNTSAIQREARARVALPPSGVVSRLTLWIDGEEREAAYAGRGRVREAYQRVVRRRRDPALVTTAGVDRVLLQCFPIPPNGEMKVKLGISAPLGLTGEQQGVLRLPRFAERNFSIPEGIGHSVWVESKTALRSQLSALGQEKPKPALHALRGEIDDTTLGGQAALIVAGRKGPDGMVWAQDSRASDGFVVLQKVVEESAARPARIVVVVDGSRGMREHAQSVADAMRALPQGVEFSLLLASDETVEAVATAPASPGTLAHAAELLADTDFVGGCDNVPALIEAWDIAAEKAGGVVLWIHGSQPLLLTTVEALRQRWERRPDGPRLYDVEATGGPNKVLDGLDGIGSVSLVPRVGGPSADIGRLLAEWSGLSKRRKLVRYRVSADSVDREVAKETSKHLVRLWARDEVLRLLESGGDATRRRAVELATQYRLVTPVSGAVVLETKRQYESAGLVAAEAGTVPTIPEPGFWALTAVALLLLVTAIVRKKMACRTA